MLHSELARVFQERARAGKVCLGIHTSSMSPQLIEMYGIVKLDFVIIGAEVESLDLSRMEDLMRAANASGTVPIVKLKRPDPNMVGEVMNIGAPMVMVPHVTTAKQLELMVRPRASSPRGCAANARSLATTGSARSISRRPTMLRIARTRSSRSSRMPTPSIISTR